MNEHKFRENLQRYLDGEIDDQLKAEMDWFVDQNPQYAIELEKERKLTQLLKGHLEREEAPYELRESVVEMLEKKSNGFSLPWLQPVLRPLAIGAMVLVLVVGVWTKNSISFPIFDESITRHVECMKGVYAMEIHTDNSDEVARWFQGKLGFAVNPPDLSEHGAKLVGARLCHLKQKKVALLTYDYNGKQITAFIMDVENMNVPRAERFETDTHQTFAKTSRGYSSILCLNKKMDDIGCVFVSDIPQDQLLEMIL